MTQNIIGINVEVQYADGTISRGHLSPRTVHIAKSVETPELHATLKLMRDSVEDQFKPWSHR